jgi:hypothetical protein
MNEYMGYECHMFNQMLNACELVILLDHIHLQVDLHCLQQYPSLLHHHEAHSLWQYHQQTISYHIHHIIVRPLKVIEMWSSEEELPWDS